MMIKKLFFILLSLCFTSQAYADIYTQDTATTTYSMPYWTRGQRNWDDRMNLGIATMDRVLTIISNDVAIGPINPIVSNDIADLKLETTILSNDAVIQDEKLTILSNDAVIQDLALSNRVSRDAILDTLKVGALTFPTTDGSAGWVLSTDGAGTLSLGIPTGGAGSSPAGASGQIQYNNGGSFGATAITWDSTNFTFQCATQPYFSASPSDDILINVSAAMKLSADSVNVNNGNDYNTSTYIFTAPVTGNYRFDYLITLTSIDSGATVYTMSIIEPSATRAFSLDPRQFAGDIVGNYSICGYWMGKLNASQTVYMELYQAGGNKQTVVEAPYTWWSGQLLY